MVWKDAESLFQRCFHGRRRCWIVRSLQLTLTACKAYVTYQPARLPPMVSIFVPLFLDCKQSLIFLLRQSRSRVRVRGERRSCDSAFLPLIYTSLLFHSSCMAQRKERQLPAVYTDLTWATDYYISLITKLLYWTLLWRQKVTTWTLVAFEYPPIVIGTENSVMNTGRVPSLPGNTKSKSDHSSRKLFCMGEPERMIRWGVLNCETNRKCIQWTLFEPETHEGQL